MTVLFKTLGCKVNRYDTETLRELFKKSGVESAKEGDIPDIIVINSCTVTAESDRKTRQTLHKMRREFPRPSLPSQAVCPRRGPKRPRISTAPTSSSATP